MIEVRDISKLYYINHENQSAYSTLVETITQKFRHCKRKLFHPFTSFSQKTLEEFWALKDISFDVNEGNRLGIIGKNGAGKSTLLKILSRIVEPTKGQIVIKGRVSSLLEVGTGFHQELTGRENIYLNGAILGMPRSEIKRKFDEIVAFAEVEKFLDTPVKRYSSGMYTRLGFAIAAHLEPDILIVDEVLSVGDMSFQEKCMKKLNNLSCQGRTIIFVSHDIGAILSLCDKGIYLVNGKISEYGPIEQCVNAYMQNCRNHELFWNGNIGDEYIRFYHASLSSPQSNREYFYQEENTIYQVTYEILQPVANLSFGIGVWNQKNQLLARSHISDDIQKYASYIKPGKHTVSFKIDAGLFHEGEYVIKLDCFIYGKKQVISDEISLKFNVYSPEKPTSFKQILEKSGIYLGNHWQMLKEL